MPKGKYYELVWRALIFRNHIIFNHDAEWIYRHCYSRPSDCNTDITLKYLKSLCVRLHDPEFAMDYLLGAKTYNKTGRRQHLTQDRVDIVIDILSDHRRIKCARLRRLFFEYYFGTPEPAADEPDMAAHISRRSLARIIHRRNWTIKTQDYRNIRRDDEEGFRFMQFMAPFDPNLLVNIDETGTDTDALGVGLAYAPSGQRCTRVQFVIRGKHYTIIAAVCPYGLLCWRIFDIPVDEDCFIEFLNTLAYFLTPEQFGFLDNAAIHHTLEVRIRLEQVFGGNFCYGPRYNPPLYPIEKVFSQVKGILSYLELSSVEEFAAVNVLALIDDTFRKFAIGGELAHVCRGEFSDLFRQHVNYLNGEFN